MNNQSAVINPTKIVVLGGGFSGVFCARYLADLAGKNIQIELISERNHFVFQPFLPEVAAGAISASDAVVPLRAMLKQANVRVRQATVRAISHENKTVEIAVGRGRKRTLISYDHLVFGMGLKVDLSRIPGLGEHAFKMKTLSDAFKLRNHVISRLEWADATEYSDLRKSLLTFVVIGAGFSGIETIGEIQEMIARVLPSYPRLNIEDVRFVVVEFQDRILPELPPSLREYSLKTLQKRGVEFRLGVATKSITGATVQLSDGSKIETSTVVATIGNGPSDIALDTGFTLERGRIVVDEFMKVKGCEDVWAIGDAACVLVEKPSPANKTSDLSSSLTADDYFVAPPTAQFAVRQARHLANNIHNEVIGSSLRRFRYSAKGALASLGNKAGCGTVYGFKVKGFLGWLVWRAFYLSFLPSIGTRLRVLSNWLIDLFLPRNTVQIVPEEASSFRFEHFREGEVLAEDGMVSDDFYIVVEGAFELTISEQDPMGPLVKVFRKGGHFGERMLLDLGFQKAGLMNAKPQEVLSGRVVALEDSIALVIGKHDFELLSSYMPILEKYFDEYVLATYLSNRD